jgi:uncharacterized protein (TIGR02246 family)
MYAKDAILLPPGGQPVHGRDAIGKYWEEGMKEGGVTDHTFEIVKVYGDGKYAYQVAVWTVIVVSHKGDHEKRSGNTARIFERQPDGKWLTKVHIFNSHS